MTPAGAQEIAKTTPLRVMELGDSITAGIGAPTDGGYRGQLAALLRKAGYRVTFVGQRSDYSSSIGDRAHEGYPGYVVRSFAADPGPGQLYGDVVRNAMRVDSPDVVLLMAGTNDLLRLSRHVPGYTMPEILHSMDLLIGEILAAKPGVHLIVAPVVASPKVDPAAQAEFAVQLKPLVAAYAQTGAHITLIARMADAVPRDEAHFPDGIHPSGAQGYGDIANVWFQAFERLTQPTQGTAAAL